MLKENRSTQYASPAEIYEQVFISAVFRHWTPMLLEFATPKAGEHILDLACGTGIVARNAAKHVNSDGRIVGLDISPAMLEVARQRAISEAPFNEWHEGNAEKIHFPDRTFDLVLCQAGLMLFKNKAAAASEMRRVLKDSGRAVVLVWQSLGQNPFNDSLNESLSRRMGVEKAMLSTSFSLGSQEELSSLLAGADFTTVRVYPIHYYTFVDDPDLYLDLAIKGSAALFPMFAELSDDERIKLTDGVAGDMEPVMKRYKQDGRLIYPQAANIAVAYP